MRWLDNERTIAVTGLAGSGKTVFLLSLLQHLEHFDPDRFRIANDAEITAFRELSVDGAFDPFPRTRLRAKLMEAQNVAWPEKTRDIYRYRCSFHYSALGLPSRIWNKLRLHRDLDSETVQWDFLDFPGERLSDVHMANTPSYEEWSDRLLELWNSYERLREDLAPFLQAAGGEVAEEALLALYKQGLAKMVHGKNQLVTPSTFMLDHAGNSSFGMEDVADGGRNRVAGLPDAEFAPLPRRGREANPELAEAFAGRYALYRETVVQPLFNALNHCDRMLLLIDIPGLLSGGVGRYSDPNHMIETLAENITPSNWFFTNIDKVAFIASKSDMIHRRDQDNLKALADDMMRIARNKQPRLKFESFTASAWVSAHSVDLEDGGRALRGVPARDDRERVFRIPELKPEWPGDWPPEDPRYSYPLLSPPRLANRYLAPEQHNLEKIFDFIMA